jgi:hypothetical protein
MSFLGLVAPSLLIASTGRQLMAAARATLGAARNALAFIEIAGEFSGDKSRTLHFRPWRAMAVQAPNRSGVDSKN